MEFINFEAEESSDNGDTIHFSDDDETIDDNNFINDSKEITDDVSFYRNLDPHNADHYNKFPNQTRNPVSAVYDDDNMYFGEEDPQPELYATEGTDNVKFDDFNGFEKSINKFYNTLKNFEYSDNQLFDAILYGLIYKYLERNLLWKKSVGMEDISYRGLIETDMIKPEKIKAREILGEDLYEDILEIKDEIQLDKTLLGFFNRCFTVTEVLSKYNSFLKFFEKRDKYRFLIQNKN